MQIDNKINHGSSICYVVSDVQGMTFDDLILWAEETHRQTWQFNDANVNHLNQPWIMLDDESVPIAPPHNLKWLFFFLDRIEEALGSMFEQCIENYEMRNARLLGIRKNNVARLPWQ